VSNIFFKAIVTISLSAVGVFGQTSPVRSVDSVDLNRYQGKWYEIAKFPNRFQKKCAGDTTATYNLKPKGGIVVVNECRKADGDKIVATGEAKVVNGASNSQLKVRFAPSFLSFLPMVWGDYWIIELDREYRYAVIGDPDRKYFWILSRTPQIDPSTYEAILRRAGSQGFDTAKIQKTPQTGS
jgi:apolipoprotein D and lipocalin family protein